MLFGSDVERRSHHFHPVRGERLFDLFGRRESRVNGGVENESLESPRGRHRGQQRPWLRTDVGPAMRNVSRREKRFPRPEPKLRVADLESELSSDDVKPLILRVMHMTRRSAFV